MLIRTHICIEFWNVVLMRHEHSYHHLYALEHAVMLLISEENVLLSMHVLQVHFEGGREGDAAFSSAVKGAAIMHGSMQRGGHHALKYAKVS